MLEVAFTACPVKVFPRGVLKEYMKAASAAFWLAREHRWPETAGEPGLLPRATRRG